MWLVQQRKLGMSKEMKQDLQVDRYEPRNIAELQVFYGENRLSIWPTSVLPIYQGVCRPVERYHLYPGDLDRKISKLMVSTHSSEFSDESVEPCSEIQRRFFMG